MKNNKLQELQWNAQEHTVLEQKNSDDIE